jgi:hypothetical protein
MAGKVLKKANLSIIKKAKPSAAQKGSAQAKKVQTKVAHSSKGRSKAVSASLKKAAQYHKPREGAAKTAKKSVASAGPVSIKKNQTNPALRASKSLKAQPTIGKGKLKQVAKKLLSEAEAKAEKKKEIIQKVAAAKEKVKGLKAKQAAEVDHAIKIQKKGKKVPTPEPVFEEEVKGPLNVNRVPPVLTDAEGRPYCKVKDCDQIATVDGYCRYHYLLLWKKIQVRRKILVDGKLERYVEELTARYPDKFLEVIRKDLLNEKNFQAAIAELEIDEPGTDSEFEEDDTQVIEEVRSFSDSTLIGDDEF